MKQIDDPVKDVISVPIYGWKIDVLITTKYDEVRRAMEVREMCPCEDRDEYPYSSFHYDLEKMRGLLVLNTRRPEVIAHECFHITAKILHRAGLRLGEKSEEAFAYLLGYIVQRVTRIVALRAYGKTLHCKHYQNYE